MNRLTTLIASEEDYRDVLFVYVAHLYLWGFFDDGEVDIADPTAIKADNDYRISFIIRLHSELAAWTKRRMLFLARHNPEPQSSEQRGISSPIKEKSLLEFEKTSRRLFGVSDDAQIMWAKANPHYDTRLDRFGDQRLRRDIYKLMSFISWEESELPEDGPGDD